MPRETLNRDQIVEAAIELLDDEGVEGLSMRRLGKRLNSAATAMYWHVGSKENLVVLAADRVWGEIELIDPLETGWRTAARALIQDTYAMVKAHPWLIPAISTYFVHGPGMARFQNHSYAIHEAAGFKGRDLDWAVNATFTFVAGTALLDATQAAAAKAKASDLADRADEVAAQYPRLRERTELLGGPDAAELLSQNFAFGLETVLDGLEARLRGADRRSPVESATAAQPSGTGARTSAAGVPSIAGTSNAVPGLLH
ncbi:TetR/AcrR family transcriptional regulator C-terminal domain-containing protein [Streptomyces sp. NPDC047082]|uniref:TetR/AcrR family transcriptional regulator n=1 Tax=Streptomyces sp. NPDC047082 TaxID=3155259 RepID=UPI0033ED6409